MNLNRTNFNQVMANIATVRGQEAVLGLMSLAANKSYEETEFHQALIVNADSIGYSFDNNDDRPERIVKTFFAGVSSYLSKRKISKPDEAVALVLQDTAGIFKFAAIVEYSANEKNPEEPGNWNYSMTVYEDDLTDLEKIKTVKKFLVGDDAFKSIMDKTAYDIGGFVFERETYIYDACLLVIDTIIQVLDHEAKEGQKVTIEMPGYFTGEVEVVNGEKSFAIIPDGHMKALIKSDIDLEG